MPKEQKYATTPEIGVFATPAKLPCQRRRDK
jgi:hypothetical protein